MNRHDTRDAYVQELKTKLDEWNAQIDILSARAERLQADAKMEIRKQIEVIKNERRDALRQLDDLQSASETAWRDLRAGIEAASERVSNALAEAASRFN